MYDTMTGIIQLFSRYVFTCYLLKLTMYMNTIMLKT